MANKAFTKLPSRLLTSIICSLGLFTNPGLAQNADPALDLQWDFIDTNCIECHNLDDFSGGLAFDLLDKNQLHNDGEIWEEVVRKLRSGMMPPPTQNRPDPAILEQFVSSLESTLDEISLQQPNPGSPILHRLNRAEYQNAIRDLLDLSIDSTALFPSDDSSGGFDNIANVLSISPALMQAYVSSAAKISRLAIGDMTTSSSISSYQPLPGASQAFHREGSPLGTRGGVSVVHMFPLDAEYEFNVRRGGVNPFALPAIGLDEQIEIVIDGERVSLFDSGRGGNITLTISAGPHQLDIATVHQRQARGVDDLHSVFAGSTGVQNVAITGPLNPSSSGSTPSRNRIFVCRPEIPSEQRPCAQQIIQTIASRAFRKPVDEASLEILMTFYEDGLALRGFDTGIQYALARILVDPQFIFRFEAEPSALSNGEIYAINDVELASRLSFFLWSSIPDDELLALANSEQLSNTDVLSQQVTRMLADPKATALVENYASQWLSLRALATINPTNTNFDGSLRESLRRETELLFGSILEADGSIVELLTADYTFLDERLAQHYGIPNIRGSRFRRVDLVDSNRRGLLGHGSILTLTSAPNRTSPVMRGTWILENIFGAPPPPPPAGVETNLEETAQLGEAATTIRQRLERHRDNPACVACHRMIDPIGFALENFDSIGQWRDESAGNMIDASSTLWDGTPITGPESLREAIVDRSDMFVMTATEKLMTYALGRTIEHYDMQTIRKIVRDAEQSNYKFSDLVNGIVASPAFLMRKKVSQETAQASL